MSKKMSTPPKVAVKNKKAQAEVAEFYPKSVKAWRAWLQNNHEKEQSIWLLIYKKESGMPSLDWSQAVDQALCFGWIDSVRQPIDNDKFRQFFSRRKPNGTWSKINKEKITRLIATGEMAAPGLASIERAKQNGSWTILDEVEELIIPKDLEQELIKYPHALNFFSQLSKSVKKSILQWLVLAKRQETRMKRIEEIASKAAKKQKPAHIQ